LWRVRAGPIRAATSPTKRSIDAMVTSRVTMWFLLSPHAVPNAERSAFSVSRIRP
jgi:hypothetical protein